ncbi:hypothetical protein BD770DRAFT_413805 [Pilaira anomala]|nr:hypothetical protein BD770DRAFT_413805 [Pilaira anomala]
MQKSCATTWFKVSMKGKRDKTLYQTQFHSNSVCRKCFGASFTKRRKGERMVWSHFRDVQGPYNKYQALITLKAALEVVLFMLRAIMIKNQYTMVLFLKYSKLRL